MCVASHFLPVFEPFNVFGLDAQRRENCCHLIYASWAIQLGRTKVQIVNWNVEKQEQEVDLVQYPTTWGAKVGVILT